MTVDRLFKKKEKRSFNEGVSIEVRLSATVNIAHRHQTFSGSGSKTLESMIAC